MFFRAAAVLALAVFMIKERPPALLAKAIAFWKVFMK
jgi:hypothetical protein